MDDESVEFRFFFEIRNCKFLKNENNFYQTFFFLRERMIDWKNDDRCHLRETRLVDELILIIGYCKRKKCSIGMMHT